MAGEGRAPKNWKKLFLTALRETGNIRFSADKAGITRAWVYALKEKDSRFAEEFNNALQEAVDGLDLEAWRRAKLGVLRRKPIYMKKGVYNKAGVRVGEEIVKVDEIEERKYSDTLLWNLLRSHRRELYGDKTEITGKDGSPLQNTVIVLPDNGRDRGQNG